MGEDWEEEEHPRVGDVYVWVLGSHVEEALFLVVSKEHDMVTLLQNDFREDHHPYNYGVNSRFFHEKSLDGQGQYVRVRGKGERRGRGDGGT